MIKDRWLNAEFPAPGSARAAPELSPIVAALSLSAPQTDDVAAVGEAVLRQICDTFSADYAALVAPDGGLWPTLADAGRRTPLPRDLLADVLDREAAGARDEWLAAPCRRPAAKGDLLVIRSAKRSGDALSLLAQLAALLGPVLAGVRARRSERRRIGRLAAILDITNRWNQTQEMEPLLVQMAEAATRLLRADRASIFLWDRPNHSLVGRPALGVEGNELRIPDDSGVVGHVVQTGEPKRVDLTRDQDQIDRQVDARLGYETRTLLCVPLCGRNGERFGAFEVINRLEGNFTDEDEEALNELAAHAAVALENTQQREKLLRSRRQVTEQAAGELQLIGRCPAVEALRSTIRRVANTDLAILLLGENGTGKEVVSRSIHYLSSRRDEPFIAVNCAALTETLLESELFGHEKGAFTDAVETRAGKFELASGGTLFLDEIGDLSLAGQAKLLRVLEEKVIVRVGGSKTIHTDARVIAATNQDLAELVRQKKFREDLYYRLNVVAMVLPPLRERGEDVLVLAEHFLAEFAARARRRVPVFSEAARQRLMNHTWPGNVRELRNLMERIAYLSSGDTIEASDLAFILAPTRHATAAFDGDLTLAQATDQFQADYIRQAIERAGGNMSEAARLLGLHRSNLYRKMRQLGMPTTG